MIYNLRKVTGDYVKGFLEFVRQKNFIDVDTKSLYELFSYSLETIYNLPAAEMNEYIQLYGGECTAYLKKLKNVPKRISKLGMSDRVAVVTMCKSYFVAADALVEGKGCAYDSKESL